MCVHDHNIIIVIKLLFVSDVPYIIILFEIQYYTTSNISFAIPTTYSKWYWNLFCLSTVYLCTHRNF